MSDLIPQTALMLACQKFEHDMRTPLLTLYSLNKKLNDHLPGLLELHKKDTTNELSAKNRDFLEKLPKGYDVTLERLNQTFEEFLVVLKDSFFFKGENQ